MQDYNQNYNYNYQYPHPSKQYNSGLKHSQSLQQNNKAKKIVKTWIACFTLSIAAPLLKTISLAFLAVLGGLSTDGSSANRANFSVVFYVLIGISSFVAHILAIVAKIKFPNHNSVKTIFIIDIIVLFLSAIAI